MYTVYILKSTVKERYYVGVSKNILRRIKQHNAGYTRGTKAHRPWVILYQETHETASLAYTREKYFRKPKGRAEKKEIIKNLTTNADLNT